MIDVVFLPMRSNDGRKMSIPVSRIDLIEEMDNGNAAITVNGQRIPTDFTVKDVEDMVTKFHFHFLTMTKV